MGYYWEKSGEGGDEKAQQCGWLKDKYGLSWQVIPVILFELLNDSDKGKSSKVMEAMLQMKKIDIAELHRATDHGALPNHPVPLQLHVRFFLIFDKENNHAQN